MKEKSPRLYYMMAAIFGGMIFFFFVILGKGFIALARAIINYWIFIVGGLVGLFILKRLISKKKMVVVEE